MASRQTEKVFPRPPEYEDDAPQPSWPTFAEKLLLALIDAYPQTALSGQERAENSERQGRLEDALYALFEIERPKGNSYTYKLHALMAAADDIREQVWAEFEAAEVINVPKSVKTKAKSKRTMAQSISGLIKSNSVEASTELLRKAERTERKYLQQIAVFNHHQEEEEMERDLQAIRRILAKWNIKLTIEPEALGMASLWGRKRGN
jgi:hypothetical protein